MPAGDVWGNSWGDSWNSYWAQATVAPVVEQAELDPGAGSGRYRLEDDEIAQWLLSYFPPRAIAKTPELVHEHVKPKPKPIQLAEVEPYTADLLAIERVRELFTESQRIEKRARTAQAERKLRQIARDRDAVKAQLNELVERIVRRKRRDEEAAMRLVMRFL